MFDPDAERPKAVLVAIQRPQETDAEHQANLDELGRLSHTLGLDVVGRISQRRAHPRAGTVLGVGKLAELALWTGGSGRVQPIIQRKGKNKQPDADDDEMLDAEDAGFEPEEGDEHDAADEALNGPPPNVHATVVVVDLELSPREARNLERATEAQVLDRTQVIVEIFHRHAKSREARLEVEVARLIYVAPRLREAGAGADRQRGGIGGKGAGESAVELDRRRIRDRIAELRREISRIHEEQANRRSARRDQRRVALVGYTNAGKSSLMRALTGSEVLVADKLFATLDTTVRALKPETDPRILLSDTVGFIKNLPHELVASFRSTLDEALEASLLLFVVDGADPTFRSQLEVTQSVLADIGAHVVPSRIVLNKRDKITEDEQARLRREFPDALMISTRDRSDVSMTRDVIISFFDGELVEESIFVPYARHGLIHKLFDTVTVLEERHDDDGTHVKMRGARAALDRILASFQLG